MASGIPMPVSRTVKRISIALASRSGIASTTTSMWPSGVNLIALPIRLNRIWRSRVASPTMLLGTLSLISTCNDNDFSSAFGRITSTTVSTIS